MSSKSKKKSKTEKKLHKKNPKAELGEKQMKTAKVGKSEKDRRAGHSVPPDWAQDTRYNARFTWVSTE